MSTTVDNRVVEMRFDNAQFEKGVATSMSTIDKLKQKLKFSDSSKGLENLGKATKNADMSGLSRGIDAVQTKFSAMQVAGVTALANITNSAVNTGKRIVSAFTIDPVKTGFQEYETQIGAIQTILANTQKEGTNVEIVNKALDELNQYADKTIYNFTEMTRNIGTFTAAGVKLDTSVNAIKGIANLAAVSGSTSQQASTAMYQLSQALAAGTVRLMDWNSVVNAGMGGQVFQDALIRTSELLGTGAKKAIEMSGSFRDSLTKGEWLTTEVLTETLNQLAGAYSKADLLAQGYTEEQANEILKLADTAQGAATKVKTFTQLFDTLKEAAQSGWSQTWRILIGDFEEAEELFTRLSNFLGNFINKSSESRNRLLEGAMSMNPFSKLAERIEKVTGVTEKMTKTTKDYSDIVNKVIGGEFGNGQKRIEALTKAGYDWAHVQNLVNEKLGDSTRHTTNYKEAQEEAIKTQTRTIDDLVKMGDAQLKQLGFAKDEIEAFRELEEQSKKTGIPINKLIKDMDQLNGRTLMINSFKNVGQGLTSVLEAIGKAWRDIFPPMTETQLYNIIAALHKFSTNAIVSEETAGKLTRTFKGLFAIIDIITTVVGGGFKLAFKGLSKILEAFDMDILDLTANIGDAIVGFRNFLFDNKLVNKGFELLALGLSKTVKAAKELYETFRNLPKVQSFIEKLHGVFYRLQNIDLSEIGHNIIEGLKRGLNEGITSIPSVLVEIGKSILTSIKEVLGIHSPSTEMEEVGENTIEGLLNGLQNGVKKVGEFIRKFANTIVATFNNMDWNKIYATGVSLAMILFVKKIGDAIGGISLSFGLFTKKVGDAISDIADEFKGLGEVFRGFGKVLKSIALDFKAKALQKMAIALAILVGSIIALSFVDIDKLWDSVKIIGALSAILVALAFATDKMSQASVKIGKNGSSVEGLKSGLIAIGAALLLLAATVKIIGSLNPDQAKQGFVGLTGLIFEMGLFLTAFALLSEKTKSMKHVSKMGTMLLKLSVALALMVGVVKLASRLSEDEVEQGAGFVIAFGVLVAAIAMISKGTNKNISKVGSLMLKLSFAIGLMVGVVKLISMLSLEEILKGAAFVTAFTIFIKALINITKIGKKQKIAGIGFLMLSISTSLLLMIGVCKLIGTLSIGDVTKGIIFVGAFTLLIKAVVEITTIGNDQKIAKVAAVIISMSVAIGIMAGVAVVLGLINLGDLAKGVAAVSLLGLVMAAMIHATKGASDVKGNLIVMTVAIGLMAGSVAALSMIDGSKLAGATAALSILMGMFALIAKTAGTMGKVMAPLIAMTLAVGALAGILYLLQDLPVDSTMAVATALSELLLAISVSMSIISKSLPIMPNTLIAIGAMVLVTGALAGILYLLKDLPVESTLSTATSLSILLLALSGACLILSGVGLAGPAAFIGIGALATLIAAMGTLMVAIGKLSEHFPGMETLLDKGIPLLNKIGKGIGSFFGNIVGGFSEGMTSGLSGIGTNLSDFMTNLEPFIAGTKNIDESAINGITNLGKMMAMLAGANIVEKISEWLTGSSSIDTFSAGIVSFGEAIVDFSNTVSGKVDEGSVEAAANAGALLSQMHSTIQGSGGVIQWFCGEKDLSSFSEGIVSFGSAIVGFSEAVKGGVNEEDISSAVKAGTMLAGLQSSLEPMGGVIDFFIGSKDLSEFGTQISKFGEGLAGFFDEVDGKINGGTVALATLAGTMLAKLQEAIPEDKWFDGKISLDTFGSKIKTFGTYLVGYSKVVSQIDNGSVSSSISDAERLVNLSRDISGVNAEDIDSFDTTVTRIGSSMKNYNEQVKDISTDAVYKSAAAALKLGNLISALTGIDASGINKFNVSPIGSAIKEYSITVSGIDASTINSSISSVRRLIKLINDMSGINEKGVSVFVSAINNLGKVSLDGIAKPFEGSSFKMITIGKDLITSLTAGVRSKIPEIVSSISGITSLMHVTIVSKTNLFTNAGINLMTSLASGITSKRGDVSNTANGVITSAAVIIRGQYTSFRSAGAYLATGFANGIELNAYLSRMKAAAMAKAAAKAIRDVLNINSPSKVTEQDGKWFGEGFANGITDKIDLVKEKAGELGESATDALATKLANGSDIAKVIQDQMGDKLIESVEATQDKINEVKTRDLSAENAYWANLLATRQNGVDALKYKDMDLAKFEEDILNQTTTIWDNYLSEIDNKTKSIMEQRKLFDEVPEPKQISKFDLITNLSSQINEYERFSETITSLNMRLEEGGLKDYVNTLGVDSVSELQALNSMTDVELTTYVQMYDQKFALAKTSALTQLDNLKWETEAKLSNLFGGVTVDAESFSASFTGSMDSIKQYVAESLEQAELAKMVGSKLTEGVAVGISDSMSVPEAAASDMIKNVLTATKKAADIHSPSRLFERQVGNRLVEGIAAGMKKTLTTLTNTIRNDIIGGSIETFRGSYDQYFEMGVYVAEGFKEGILSKAEEIAEAAASIAAAAMAAVQSALAIASPSKKMYKLGEFTGQGFVNGIRSYGDKTYKAGSEVANSAKEGLTNAIGKVNDFLNSDLDAQPVIRPVMDLSSVESGISTIDGLFNTRRSLGMSANINAIRSITNQNQNEGFYDVVSAINKLREDLSGMDRSSYNVNGITYDDGSNVSEAIKSLVRAAKVERRT